MMHKINPPVWRFPKKEAMEKIVIAIDRQKPWEKVIDYSERVVALFDSRKMSVKNDNRFMGRVFLGGLNENILDMMIENGEIPFREANLHAEFLEYWIQHGTIYRHIFVQGSDEDQDENEVEAEDEYQEEDYEFEYEAYEEYEQLEEYEQYEEYEEYQEEEEGADCGCGLYGDGAVYGIAIEEPGAYTAVVPYVPVVPVVPDNLSGEGIFGEPNQKVDNLYNALYVLILYR